MKKSYCILTLCLFCLALTAQDVTEKTKKEMNRIKLSKSYISAEATMPTLQEAIDIANESLLQSIDQWVKEEKKYQGTKQVAIQDINSCLEKIDMNRGGNVRVLVYIKKKDIIPIYGNGLILLTGNELNDEISPLAATPELVADKPQATSAPQETANPEQASKASPLQRILAAQTMKDIKIIFHELKGEHAISYGKYNSTDLDISNYYLLFYNRQGQVSGVLGKGGQERVNLRTTQREQLTRYNGHAAYWFTLTNE